MRKIKGILYYILNKKKCDKAIEEFRAINNM